MSTELIGVDFGTSTVLVASRAGLGPVRTVPVGAATPWMPTLAGIGERGLLIGEDAQVLPERSVIRSVKTALSAGHESVAVQRPDGTRERVSVEGTVRRIFEGVIDRSRRAGTDLVGRPVRLSCPANWEASPRRRLVDLARSAGLDASVNRMLDEPISAGVAWVMGRYLDDGQVPDGKVLVFDYGGGTLDVAVLQVRRASPPEITVLASTARTEAGDRLDAAIAEELREDLSARLPPDAAALTEDELDRLFRLAATRLKEGLSGQASMSTALPLGQGTPVELRYDRIRLEQAFEPMLQRAMQLVWATLRATELRRRGAASPDAIRAMEPESLAKEVSWVLLAGGMSRVPAVRARLEREFPNAIVQSDPSLGAPEESVVAGLVHEEVVSELNLDRPAFDFSARIVDPRTGEQLDRWDLYPAFTPLYTSAQVLQGMTQLGRGEPRPNRYLRPVLAELVCTGVDGRELPLHVSGNSVGRVAVEVPPGKNLYFRLYVDGRVVFGPEVFRVHRWPVIRGGPNNRIELRREEGTYGEYHQPGWWAERL